MRIFAGHYKNQELKSPKGPNTRPTSGKVRESIFSILHPYLENASFLDLFAGSGSMGIEALSRGAQEAIFVEKDAGALRCLYDNLKKLQIEATVFKGDVLRVIKRLSKENKKFDIIYMDPPYSLDITDLFPEIALLLKPDSLLVVEQSSKQILSPSSLQEVSKRNFGDTAIFLFKL